MPEKKVKILLDLPVEDGVLGFGNYRDALVNIIKGSEPRFTIGIFGSWGTGKTTLMRMMKKRLDDGGAVTVWFNPWQFEKEKHLLVPLLQTLKLELETKYKDQAKEILKALGDIAVSFAKSIKPEINLGITKISFDPEKFIEKDKEEKDFASLYFALNQKLKEIIKEIKNDRIVIFVDDLDRCLPDKALQVLESAKVFLDAEGYVFVIGLDRDIIEKCVDKKYGKESGISGTDYIKKIIQVPFNLPGLREQDVKTYVQRLKEQLKDTGAQEHVEKYIDIISKGMEANPREIKRFINNFILANQISAGETEPDKLLVLLIIQFRWEELFKTIATHKKGFLNKLKYYLENKESVNPEDKEKFDQFKENCGEHYDFFIKIESHLLYDFLHTGEGKILFEIDDLDPYIHFSKAATIEIGKDIRFSWENPLISLLLNGNIDEFNLSRPRPFVGLAGAQLRGAGLNGVDLSGADLSGANLSGIRIEKKRGPDRLTGMSGVSIFGHPTSLQNADLRGATLARADLTGVVLNESDLSNADLSGIVVDEDTLFVRTIIQGVKNLSPEIRSTLHIEKENGVEKATSRRLMKRE